MLGPEKLALQGFNQSDLVVGNSATNFYRQGLLAGDAFNLVSVGDVYVALLSSVPLPS